MPVPESCPKCGGSTFFDNRAENMDRIAAGQKARPDFKCKAVSCDWVQWPPKNGHAAAPKPAPPKVAYNTPVALPGEFASEEEELRELHGKTQPSKGAIVAHQYEATLDWVLSHVCPKLTQADIPVDAAAVNSMIATILIQASKAA